MDKFSHVLNNLDVGRFGSNFTILNAQDATVIVPTTNQLSDLYTRWNQSIHNMRTFTFIHTCCTRGPLSHSLILIYFTHRVHTHTAINNLSSRHVQDAQINNDGFFLFYQLNFPSMQIRRASTSPTWCAKCVATRRAS
jgi:hypothetical protein